MSRRRDFGLAMSQNQEAFKQTNQTKPNKTNKQATEADVKQTGSRLFHDVFLHFSLRKVKEGMERCRRNFEKPA